MNCPLTVLFFYISIAMNAQQTLIHKDGNRTVYEVTGKGKEVIIFIHAGGLDRHMWKEQIITLNQDYKLISYDIRGHGQSTFKSNSRYEIDDLKSILEQENINKITLVGCSLGSIIALDFAINHPYLVHRLVLVSPGLVGLQEKDLVFLKQMNRYVGLIQKGDTAAIMSHLKLLNALGRRKGELPEQVDAYVQESLALFVKSRGLLRVPVLKTTHPMESVTSLSMKTMLIVGEWDHSYILNNAGYIKQSIKNTSLHQIIHAGHLPNMEQVASFNKILVKFLNAN